MSISTSGYHHSLRHVVYYDHVASGKESERMILSPSRGTFTDECQGPAVMFVAVGVHERIQDVDPTSESQERQGRLWTDCSGGFGWKHPMRTRNLTLRGHSDHTAFQGAPVGRWPLLARHLGCALCSRLYQLSKSHWFPSNKAGPWQESRSASLTIRACSESFTDGPLYSFSVCFIWVVSRSYFSGRRKCHLSWGQELTDFRIWGVNSYLGPC